MSHCWWIGFVVGDRRLDHHRGRPPALDRARACCAPRTPRRRCRPTAVLMTLILFVLAYGVVFSFGIYYINRLINRGPEADRELPDALARTFSRQPDHRRRTLAASSDRREGANAMEWYLPVIWAGLIGTAVAMYVILDGFDLGIGILFPFADNERERDQMMRSVAPFWDGNETWLVLGGGGLWVAFPLRLFGDHAGAVHAGDRDAAGAGVSRRGVRIPHRVAQQDLAQRRLHRRLGSRRLRARRDPRRADPGHQGHQRRLRRRPARLGDAVRCRLRPGDDRRLWPARRHLAGDEDRRPGGRRAAAGRPRCCSPSCWSSWRR